MLASRNRKTILMKQKLFITLSLIFISTISIAQTVTEVPKQSLDSLSKVYSKVEHEAEFPGGTSAWSEYLQKHLKFYQNNRYFCMAAHFCSIFVHCYQISDYSLDKTGTIDYLKITFSFNFF